ncbi:Hypothetical protein BRZCDTV_176 [Brazilian cedratvirus IHUMI]|uniref:Uncharacterized protein n=1 Tax=Brazilian cedratvirus IHUMI TaxID=2126980 RepID=A0A2R8FDR0_9VIRU|nr:Hypothetical protein BRZCDTV_176 [Brazilian cedratvirus IHUMI]
MADERDILELWLELGYEPPRRAFAIMGEETLLVVSDRTSIYSFMDSSGDVYYVSKNRCSEDERGYVCKEPLYSAGCIIQQQRADIVRQEIAPLFFNTETFY